MEKCCVSLNKERVLLVVVDMINGFLFEGPLSDPHIDGCTEPIRQMIEQMIAAKQPILAFRDSHTKDSREFSSFPVHCLANSHESELIDALRPYEDQMIVLLKNSTNGFVQPQFEATLRRMLPLDKILVTGCCTDLCVLQFALTLKAYLNQTDQDTAVIVPKNCTDTFDSPDHPRQKMNELAFFLMKNAGIQVADQIRWENEYE